MCLIVNEMTSIKNMLTSYYVYNCTNSSFPSCHMNGFFMGNGYHIIKLILNLQSNLCRCVHNIYLYQNRALYDMSCTSN